MSAHPRRLLSSVFSTGSWSSPVKGLTVGTATRRRYDWDRRTEETRWKMEDGYLPKLVVWPDGRYVRLGDQKVFETIDEM